MREQFFRHLAEQLDAIRDEGLLKVEHPIRTPQGAEVSLDEGEGSLLNFCANNYLGLANHPDLLRAAADGLAQHEIGRAHV